MRAFHALSHRPRLRAALSASLLLVLATACGGDDDGGVVTPTPTPTIGVTLAAPSVTVTAGQSGTVAVTVARNGGFAGAIGLAVEGAPAGVTATTAPASVAAGATTSTVTVATTAAAAPGTYALTVRGTGTGVAAVTAPLSVIVTAPPGFGLALASGTLSVAQGASGATRVTLTRLGGFTGPVAVAVTGLPTGVTAGPLSITGDTASLTLTAAANAAAGTSTLTVTGTGTGVTAQTASLALTVTTAPTPVGSFAIALAAPTLSVVQGGAAGTATVNVTRTAPFAGGVTITTSGAPAGLTVTPPGAAVTAGSGAISVSAAGTVAPGTYPITVSAAAAGLTTQTATLSVTVTAAPAAGGLSIAVTPTTVSLAQGGTATATVAITRTGGLTGPVDISVTGLPAGVTATITSSLLSRQPTGIRASAEPIPGNTATIRFSALPTAATGAFSFNVVASAPGVTTQTTSVQASVTPGASTGGNVGLAFCSTGGPIWVGFQSENGPWQRATLGAGNQATINITGTRGAIAYVDQSGTSFTTSIIYGTAAELTGYGASLCATSAGGKTVTGSVAGLAAGDQATVTLGGATASVSTGTAFTLQGVPPGPRDLLAVRTAFAFTGTSVSFTPSRVILRRNLDVANGATLPVLDFGGAESFAPASAQLSVTGLGSGESVIPFVSLQTANGASAAFFTGLGGITGGGSGGPQTFYGLPADRLTSTDYHLLTAVAFNASGATIDQTQGRGAGVLFRSVANRTLALSPALSTPTASIAATSPYPRPRLQLARQTEYQDAVNASFSQSAAAGARAVAITALASSLQGGATWDISVPDLSAAGYDAAWALRSGTATTYSASASGGSGNVLVGQAPTEGATFRYAFRTGTLTTLNALRASRR